jgi:predicted choloylglycine hydrolase
VLGFAVASCKKKKPECKGPIEAPRVETETQTYAESDSTLLAGTETSFPLLEVSGAPYDIGQAIGKTFADDIRAGFEKRAAWFKALRKFADAQPPSLYATFEAAAKKHTPSVFEELRGWADGSGVPLRDLMILNLKAEYEALRDAELRKAGKEAPGCSTVVLKDGRRIIIAHNEDGSAAYQEHMFMLKVHPAGKPTFVTASYPGILPGNAPWINDRGIAMTTNFIYTKEVKVGVGRYFLDRLAMESSTIDEALAISRNPERAYSFHHVIGSVLDGRVVSLEVTPSMDELIEIDGVFIHTNHLVAPALAKLVQDNQDVSTSSKTRWDVLARWKEGLPKSLDKITQETILSPLVSHEGKPYSPCRHPEGNIDGATLLTAVFDFDARTMTVYKKQPCNDNSTDYPFPSRA